MDNNDYIRANGAECALFLKRNSDFPLTNTGSIALYGSGARMTIKGGTGSGEVNTKHDVTIEEGLIEAGFTITSTKWLDGYDKVRQVAKKAFLKGIKEDARRQHTLAIFTAMGAIMPEPEYNLPLDGEGDTAIYVLSRISGEGSDRDAAPGDIKLSDTEIRDILACHHKYSKFMLVLNVGGVVDLSSIDEVENILLLSQLGSMTGHILADIITGKSNPSGKLTTTWSAWEDYPDICFGDGDDTIYNEGIYVGYRYFDTAGKQALYPFGFGLSYTEFDITPGEVRLAGTEVTATATLTNIGPREGKEVVQLYVSIPSGKLDQPYQVLAAFAKSSSVPSSSSESLTLTFDIRDLASYSESDLAYILEEGSYTVRIGNSSRSTTPVAQINIPRTIRVRSVRSCTPKMDIDEMHLTCISTLEAGAITLTVNPDDIDEIKTTYDPVYPISDKIQNLPDEDLMNLMLGAYGMSKGVQSMVGNSGFYVAGAAGQTSIQAEALGIPSMVMADGPAGVRLNRRAAIDSKGKVHPLEMGIPESMQELLPGVARLYLKATMYHPKKKDTIVEQYATALPIGTAIAQSFNMIFAQKCGDIVGEEMSRFGIHLWLAPALNIHRSIKCGRNFEYYSEDPLVSGKMAAAITRGVQSHSGCGVTIKHYACNNQEYNRTQSNSVLSERALRDIYLKGFGICIRESQPKAVMTSYNLVNGIHSSESHPLTEDILRAEYGLKGLVMTDWVISGFCTRKESIHPAAHAPNVVMAGGDLFMPGCGADYDELKTAFDEGKVTRQQLMINATRIAKMADELVK